MFPENAPTPNSNHFPDGTGEGGGNHSEQYASIFLGTTSSLYRKEPDYVAQVGSRGTGAVEPDALKKAKIEPPEDGAGLVLPGCKKALGDTMSQCSKKGDHLFIFCPSNREQALVAVGFDEYTGNYPSRNFSGLGNLLGISLTNNRLQIALGDTTIAGSGLKPKQSYYAFQIGEVYSSGVPIGLKTNDYVVSVNGK